MTALGIRSNNPCNLRPTSQKWVGELAPDPRGYCTFDTPEHGLRAGAINLRNQQAFHDLRTIEAIIHKYAPNNENDPEAYIADVVKRTGFARNERLQLFDYATLDRFLRAIVWHENGVQPYTDQQIEGAIVAALPR